ncbi:MAG: hypothetical protein CM15mP120_16180 [Pseudomonadota bacterium]|nr:MAG: hypothetical protein CM15mP120_16180 [Pseudomonadota bacterium]
MWLGRCSATRLWRLPRISQLKRTDLELSKRLSEDWGIRHEVIVTDELNKADYRANPTNRCFHCKTSLYTELQQIAAARNIRHCQRYQP